MGQTFDEAYAKYLRSLAKLDATDDIAEKNILFRQLTEQLSDLERLSLGSVALDCRGTGFGTEGDSSCSLYPRSSLLQF